MNTASELISTIQAKQAEAARLLASLPASLLIQEIWPEAYANGQPCSVHAIGPAHRAPSQRSSSWRPVSRAWLQRPDGATFPLTEEQYNALVNPGVINPNHNRSTTA